MKFERFSKVILGIFVMIISFTAQPSLAYAQETETDMGAVLVVTDIDEKTNIATAIICPTSTSSYIIGDIVGDGVRLRSAPSDTATILELMYFGEEVYVDLSKSHVSDYVIDWYYIQRKDTTQTWGYTSSQYIYLETGC